MTAAVPNQDQELWLAMPKGGKTLGGSDEAFLNAAGFRSGEKPSRIDDYTLLDGPDFRDIPLRNWIRRPKDALRDIQDGIMDVAIVGRDVLVDFNKSLPKDVTPIREILDLNMASCVLMLAVREQSRFKLLSDFASATIGSKFDSATREWLADKGIVPANIMYREGGMESLMRQSNKIDAISDIVESGASLVANGLKPFGIDDADWQTVKGGKRLVDLPMSKIAKIPGRIAISSAVLVRGNTPMAPQKERAIEKLAQRFYEAALAQGRKPKLKIKIEKPAPIRYREENSFPGHGIWLNP